VTETFIKGHCGMTGQALMRKERERIAKREEIVVAARRVFAQRGYNQATLEEIAERAEFAKGTLYNYFQSKDELFQHIMERLLDDMVGVAGAAIAGTATIRDAFRLYAARILEYYKTNEDLLRIIAREMNRMQLENEQRRIAVIHERVHRIVAMLSLLVKKEISRKRLIRESPEDLAQVFVSMVHNRAMRCFFDGKGLGTLNAGREADFLVRLFFEGASLS
jgi:AcrR family transcriptional regulator